ncbi:PREDICTED: myosin-9 [Papilio polytes]|uniref:myosin-9 n=1 Tax=Papilio polytes TaxID=76194 RepID=UPI0006766DAC|nr:PREDICTED: myosin-9 [Papilio polytes]
MSAPEKVPGYMAQLLEELGWNQGTRIPLADTSNSNLETTLISRQNEIQALKEALSLQLQKRSDLNKYKDFVHTEYQENTRLLFAQKQQLEQEIKIHQLSKKEADRLDKDVVESNKESSAAATRIDKLQTNIARLLKKADTLKSEVCGERGALQEWRAALERNASDITAIEQFTKQDLSKAKSLETKRLQLKQEHDRLRDRLNQLVGNLSAEERACERISVQVMEGMEQRKQMMSMWTGAVENLRQRDVDIRHIKEVNSNTSMQRELSNMRNFLEKLRLENKSILEEQHQKDVALKNVIDKIRELKEKLHESTDKSKSSEKRAKQLEEMLNDEERYASQMNLNQQRAMHCSFMENQKLLELRNEEKLFSMQLKASKAVMSKLDTKQRNIERTLQGLKESLYAICYQLETTGARVAHMEGAQAERECSAELAEQENRLKEVCARHAARVALLERHAARLHDDMRRLARDLEIKNADFVTLQSRLKTSMLNAMKERLVEISARRDMFGVQKRALVEECGKLRGEIREREQRVHQLIKRHDIFIASLGKDESGQQLSVTFFKIKVTLLIIFHLNATGPEIAELNELTKQYYERRDELKQVQAQSARLEEQLCDVSAHHTALADKYKQLTARESEAENQLDSLREHAQRQENRLQNAHDVISLNLKRAKKLFDDVDEWRIFKLSMYNRNFAEAAHSALQGVSAACAGMRAARAQLALLLCGEDVRRNLPAHHTRLHSYVDRIISSESAASLETPPALEASVFSESQQSICSGVSMASGYTKRLSAFRRTLAPKVAERSIADDIPDQARRSTVSLRVINLGIREPQPGECSDICTSRSRAFQ